MKRIIPGILLAAFWLLILLYGCVSLFNVVVAAAAAIAADEYVRMTIPRGEESRRFALFQRLFYDLLLCSPVLAAMIWPLPKSLLAAALLSFLLLSCEQIIHFGRKSPKDSFLCFTRIFFGIFYVGILSAHLCLTRNLPEGNIWILLATAVTAGSDTGAYFCGKQFGRHTLCQAVSPKKTIEGAIGGVLSAIAAILIFGFWLLETPDVLFLSGLAIILSLLGILGDLTESIIKRGTGIKDSGVILGGHGGVLDRVDSLLFAVPALYWFLICFTDSPVIP
ncbi:phosphatidate cytidylyltransferase [Desulforhopalus vacuolatus]|uniref:phosphatidate cytidylyltransferase n=1 Tax=Desulforhopalus vacuolatus TaxID=40414 RepID=UPI00196545F5|nr:phosphatidate cytidylyltransferase [Desulforhopalus vacuolatus]MBM9518813.1 phosphatidate cytidylyltransferase [Desulforhopalus vacuolatus]